MRILIISDTHIPAVAKELPPIIKEEASKSDCCIHAGDLIVASVLDDLSRLTETYAVCGNMDSFDLKKDLPERTVIELEEVKIGLIHGRGSPATLMDYLKKEFKQQTKELNMIIFGHTHYPLDKEMDGLIYFNPGSPTDKIFAPYPSYGIIEIAGKNIKRRIVKIG